MNSLFLDSFSEMDAIKMSPYSMNIALNVVDLLFNIYFFIKTVISYESNRFFGSFSFKTMCYLDTLLNGGFICWGAYIIVGVSFLAKVYLSTGRKFTRLDTSMFMLCSGLYSFSAIVLCVHLPTSSYGLDPAGTYCYMSFSSLAIPVGFFMSMVIPFLFLSYNLYHIQKAIKASQKLLESQGMIGQAKGHYIHMVKKLGYFLLVIAICQGPTLLYLIYEAISREYPQPYITALSGILAVSNSSILNPILFIILNIDIQDRLYIKYISKFLTIIESLRDECLGKRLRLVFPQKIDKIATATLSPSNNNDISINIDYSNWKVWVTDPVLKKSFHEYGKKEYVMENFSFYDDIVNYHALYDHYKAILQEEIEFSDNAIRLKDGRDFLLVWDEIGQYINRLYVIYIKVSRRDSYSEGADSLIWSVNWPMVMMSTMCLCQSYGKGLIHVDMVATMTYNSPFPCCCLIYTILSMLMTA